jgi:hypothetical protein
MGKITIIIALFVLISCDKNSNFTRDNNDYKKGVYVKNNTFINSSGLYYFKDVDIVVKEFKEGTIVYGIFDYSNNLLYQRNINNSISNYMKWTIYVDNKDQIWFYNADYQETNVFVLQGGKGIFIKDKNKLPQIPLELTNFIKNK